MNSRKSNFHKLSDVQSEKIGYNTTVWQFSVILPNAVIGSNCNINCHTFIENDVVIGDNCTVKSGVYLWDGITVGQNVFIGPNVTFTNDQYPKSKVKPAKFIAATIKDDVSIGANATIIGGVTINENALIGAGSVVTKDVPANAIIAGNPGKIINWRE